MHTNINPESILIGLDGRAKITDFRFSFSINKKLPLPSDFIGGSISYLAPEALKYERALRQPRVNAKLDVWAFGLLLFECLEGRVSLLLLTLTV